MKTIRDNKYLLLIMLGVWLFLLFQHIHFEENNLFTILSLFNKLLITMLLFVLFVTIGKNKNTEKKMRKELYIKSNYDKLTKTLNRETGLKILKKRIEHQNSEMSPEAHDEELYLGLFDLSGLKVINKEFGVEKGDEMIKSLVGLLRSTFRKSDDIVRLGGDQFLVIIKGVKKNKITDEKYIDNIETRFIKNLKKYNDIEENKFKIYLSKVFLQYKKGKNTLDVMKKLFQELEDEKRLEKGKYYVLENEMLEGLKNKEFQIYYQPKVNIVKKEIEFEALMRWDHPKKGMIGPSIFIPVAEKSNLIIELTFYLIETVKKDIKKLKRPISINISPIHFNEIDFSEVILKKYNNLNHISFELTEGSFIGDLKKSVQKIEKLKKEGIEFSIDDFGTGYSSLSYLAKLPVKTLKIDRSFILEMFESDESLKVIKTIIELGKSLNLDVVVEGVEKTKEIEALKNMGVSIFQGYYFGKPECLKEVLKKLDSNEYIKNIN